MPAEKFWDTIYSKGQGASDSRVKLPDLNDPDPQRALQHFGSIEDKTVIDLGCGRGATSLFFAYYGAHVISVDFSKVAIKNLSEYCQDHSISNVFPMQIPAQEISKLGKADFIYGCMILHHIEPFDEFAKCLRAAIRQGGKGFFVENNARSKIMIWFRQHVVGKAWVPKYGDSEEFPLTPNEVDEIRKYFRVQIEIPELQFFRMISLYLFRGHLSSPFRMLDNYFYKYPAIRKYSYKQYIFLS